FITLSAAYNTLDPFLSTMETSKASLLMRKFVSGLQNTKGLANAVDVADAFGSIDDSVLLDNLQQQVNLNFQKMKAKNNERGKVIYGLLATLFNTRNSHSAAGDWADQMSEKLNLPPLDYIPYEELTNAEGHIYEEVFFYGDKDGFASYRSFMSSFNNSANWDIKSRKYWVEINSSRGKPITIFAKKPMATEDEEGMRALQQYLKENDINPSIFIHRGHSYHAQASIAELQSSAKLVMLGSCGGYNNLAKILNVAPRAQIITTKQTGATGVNEPIIRTIERQIREGKDLRWGDIWDQLNAYFKGSHYYTLFQDYIPPQENLGAVFIKAYKKIMKKDVSVDDGAGSQADVSQGV